MDVTTNYLQGYQNELETQMFDELWRSNPFEGLVDKKLYDPSMGMTPRVLTLQNTMPTAYPTDVSDVSRSTGTGDVSCSLSATRVERGGIERTYKLVEKAFDTDNICANDLSTAERAEIMLRHLEDSIKENIITFISDFYRLANLTMSPNKAVVLTNGGLTWAASDDYTYNFDAPGALPSSVLTWDHLTAVYQRLMRSGFMKEAAIGTDGNGLPVLPLVASAATIRRLTVGNTQVRETINYYDPSSNLKVLGYTQAINGFLLILDLLPIRFAQKATTTSSGTTYSNLTAAELLMTNSVYPTVNTDLVSDSDSTTYGKGHKVNPNYSDLTHGGKAQYEVATIVPRGTWDLVVSPSSPSKVSQATYKPSSYAGDVTWINNPTFRGANDRGRLGYYAAEWRGGIRPGRVKFGVSLLQLAKD